MAEDPTTQTTAPADAGQPVTSAVPADPPVSSPAEPTPAAAPAPAEAQPAVAERLFAGKYKTPEELEQGYAKSSDEAIRLYQENQRLLRERTAPATPTPQTTPTYSAEQLETWKEQRLVEAAQAAASGDGQKAAEAAHQIRLIDSELRKMDLGQFSTKAESQMAMQALQQVAQPVLDQYTKEMTPGTPFQVEASKFYQQAVTALKGGVPPEQILGAAAMLLAAHTTGKTTQGLMLEASKQATKSLNQQIKAAAVAGSGGASAAAAAPFDWKHSTRAEREAERKKIRAV